MSKILDINLSLQIPNMVFKSDTDNSISQITDKAQNIPFAQSDVAKRPVYNYDGYINSSLNSGFGLRTSKNELPDFGDKDFYIHLKFRVNTGNNRTAIFIPYNGNTSHFFIYANGASRIETTFYSSTGASTSLSSYSLAINDRMDKWTFLAFEKRGDKVRLFAGNEHELNLQFTIENTLPFTKMQYNADTPLNLLADIWGSYTGNVDLAFFRVGFGSVFYDNMNINVPFNSIDNFTHFKRFQNKEGNKKLFLTSNNLEGAVIDSANQITSIKSEIYDGVHPYYTVLTKKSGGLSLTNNGLYFEGTGNVVPMLGYLWGWDTTGKTANISTWFNPDPLIGNLDFLFSYVTDGNFTGLRVYHSGGNLIVQASANGTSWDIFNTSIPITLDTWSYFSFIKTLTGYCVLINGIIRFSIITPLELYQFQPLMYVAAGGSGTVNWKGYIDDFLFSIGDSIIDPTGYSVGDKVFEPPRRKSLEVKEAPYNDGKYTFSELNKMIREDGYIPVASADDLDNLRTTITQEMGVGTAWVGDYLTGVDKKYIQINDIDISFFSSWNTLDAFSGIFDGNKTTITGVVISQNSTGWGLFRLSATNNSILRNIKIDGIVSSSAQGVGLLSGNTYGIVEDCEISGSCNLSASSGRVGGMGQVFAGATIRRNKSSFSIISTASNYFGSLIGLINGASTVHDNHASGSVNGNDRSGGLVGANLGGSITNCYATGLVSGAGSKGGLCALNTGTFVNSYWDTITSGQATSAGGTGKTTAELQADDIGAGIYVNWTKPPWNKAAGEYPQLIGAKMALQFITD